MHQSFNGYRSIFTFICHIFSKVLFLLISVVWSSASASEALTSKIDRLFSQAIAQAKPLSRQDSLRKMYQVEINPLIGQYTNTLTKCREDKSSADTRCLESENKDWNNFSNLMGSMGDMASMSMSASCSKLADLLKMGQGAQIGFRAQCGIAKGTCEESCTMAVKLQKTIAGKMDSVISGAKAEVMGTNSGDEVKLSVEKDGIAERLKVVNEAACADGGWNNLGQRIEIPAFKSVEECDEYSAKQRRRIDVINNLQSGIESNQKSFPEQISAIKQELESNADENSPSSLLKACNDKAQVIQKTATNIMSLMTSMQQNQACADEFATFDSGIDLKNCALTGTCTPTDTSTDCADAKYKDSVYCKNYAGNNSGGTSTTGGGTNAGSFQDPSFDLDSKGTLGDLNMNGTGDLASLDPNDPDSPLNKLGPGADPKNGGVPTGGGGGGLSIPGGGYNPRGGGRYPSGAEGANYGASPSYAGSGNFGGGGGDKNKDDLQKYLPGAEKDPALAKKGGPEGITAPGGMTLFEKVTKSYRNNRSTLIPE